MTVRTGDGTDRGRKTSWTDRPEQADTTLSWVRVDRWRGDASKPAGRATGQAGTAVTRSTL
ncbi:hypothetical protein [Streptomyces incanus]|uniref:Uncharacterized protein n=1 Tax=Streptomyces incanus TaxID=887453 RepID=A0ABW0XG98_9ACTN